MSTLGNTVARVVFIYMCAGRGTAITLVLNKVLVDIQTKEDMMIRRAQQVVILISDGEQTACVAIC